MTTRRATFGHVDLALKGLQAEASPDFAEVHKKLFPVIRDICDEARLYGIRYIWHFYEPYAEITWYANDTTPDANRLFEGWLKKKVEAAGYHDVEFQGGEQLADWFCLNEREREFGGKRHDLCNQFVTLVEEYRDAIEAGKGVHQQVKRTIHTICNPLGIGYWEEAKICFSRGLICLLFKVLPFKRAVWVYTKIFRQSY